YYPGGVDPEELELTATIRTRLANSLAEYRAGSLARALEQFPGYPRPAEPASEGEHIYLAALFLAVGAVDQAEAQLAQASANAQAHAADGFLLAAENRINEAITEFDAAIELDPGLGNAWLGRGLCKRRLGCSSLSTINHPPSTVEPGWLSDLQAAAAAEPQRS